MKEGAGIICNYLVCNTVCLTNSCSTIFLELEFLTMTIIFSTNNPWFKIYLFIRVVFRSPEVLRIVETLRCVSVFTLNFTFEHRVGAA